MQDDGLKTEGTGQGDGRDTESSKVEFTSEQQTKVQKLIDEAYRRAYTKASSGAAGSEQMERLKVQIDGLRDEKKMSTVLRTVARHNVIDAEEVAELIMPRVKMDDDGNMAVCGESGASVINRAGQRVGIEEYVALWLRERPHHLRSAAASGAGSMGAGFDVEGGAKHDLSDPNAWRNMPREDLERLLREGIDVHGSAGQVFKFKDVKNPFLEARKRKFQSTGG